MNKRLAILVCMLSSALALAKPPAAVPARPPVPSKPRPVTAATTSDAGMEPSDAATQPAPAPSDRATAQPSDGGTEMGPRTSPLTPPAAEFPQVLDAGAAAFDYDRVLSDIAALRARVSAATELMFRSRMTVQVRSDGKYAKIARLNVALDDGTVFTGKPGFKPDDFVTVYEHAVAPGRHAVTVDVERADAREEGFRSSQKSRLIVDVPKDQKLTVEVILVDESTMGGDFPSDKSGRYDLRIRMRAVAKGAP
jgi:hypothetical protein